MWRSTEPWRATTLARPAAARTVAIAPSACGSSGQRACWQWTKGRSRRPAASRRAPPPVARSDPTPRVGAAGRIPRGRTCSRRCRRTEVRRGHAMRIRTAHAPYSTAPTRVGPLLAREANACARRAIAPRLGLASREPANAWQRRAALARLSVAVRRGATRSAREAVACARQAAALGEASASRSRTQAARAPSPLALPAGGPRRATGAGACAKLASSPSTAAASSSAAASGQAYDKNACMGKNSANCKGACTWDFVQDWKKSCIPQTCTGLKHDDCSLHPKKCEWKWTGDWKTSCQATGGSVHPSDSSGCMGKNSANCKGTCMWDFVQDWKTSCIPQACMGLNHDACDLHPKKCGWKWTGSWKTSCQTSS
mmetsp:Transcript_69517/g.213106  ORF Transcript_69517/g.213106 Transcript_69517/m.213106 type:complete len:370 (-) Transcript_69517:82-1191(-)